LVKRLFLYIILDGVVQYKHTLTYFTYIYLYKTVKAIKLHNIKTRNIESIKED